MSTSAFQRARRRLRAAVDEALALNEEVGRLDAIVRCDFDHAHPVTTFECYGVLGELRLPELGRIVGPWRHELSKRFTAA